MNIGYFPGCSSHGLAREYDVSARLVCKHLGINLQELQDWNCCGATAAHSLNRLLSLSLAARNLNIARKMDLDEVTTPCAGCFNRLKTASWEFRNKPELRGEIQKIINAPLPVEPEVKNLLQLIVEKKGLAAVADKVTRHLNGLKVAAYYGCLLTRPRRIVNFDDSEQPVALDQLLQVLGIETVSWSHKAECCGGGYAASATNIVRDLGGQVLASAYNAGAQAIVVACPMCQNNLDIRQESIEQEKAIRFNLPVIYFTQLMGLAFGYSVAQLGLKRLLVNPLPLLQEKGLL